MNKTIVLFDMDGTLTPCRGKISFNVISALRQLSENCRIGIVSGSDIDYILQQCGSLFDIGGVALDNIDILPCNGTKFYKWKHTKFEIVHNNDMSKKLGLDKSGASKYQKLIRETLYLQAMAAGTHLRATPLLGTFLQYRGSMLNWCFVGRDADIEVRKNFVKVDVTQGIRNFYKKHLDDFVKKEGINVTTALGGETSIDIYPVGWDKTYALSYYPGHDVYFVGDACQEGGNDWHIYWALKDLENNIDKSYHTSGTEETVKIIDDIMQRL